MKETIHHLEINPPNTVEQVFPCRCGETHRGEYALYDYGHHNCFHDDDLVRLDKSQLVCFSCGKVFHVK